MPETAVTVEIDGARLDGDQLAAIVEVQAEEATDAADAVTLVAGLTAGDDGEWRSVLDGLVTPWTHLVVELRRGAVTYRFEGTSAEAEWQVDPAGASQLTVKALDATAVMDAEEKVVSWPSTADSAIASAIFRARGLTAVVDDTPAGPDPDVHVVLQRGSDWAFLQSLAAKWGYAAYVESEGPRVIGYFHQLRPLASPQAELVLGFGGDAGPVSVTAQLTAGQRVTAMRVPALSSSGQRGDAPGTDQALGRTSLGGQVLLLLAPADVEGEVEPAAAARGVAQQSAYTTRLTAEIDVERTGVMLRARRPVLVRGLGSALSGRWLVGRVRHRLTAGGHRMEVTLLRNAFGLKGDEPFGVAG